MTAANPSGGARSVADNDITHVQSDNRLTIANQPSQSPATPRLTFDVGTVAGPYRILQRLGKGGMGEVFEAEQIESGRRVALKVLTRSLDNPEATARFLREGRLAAKVSHPNSVYVYASHEVEGVPMIAMELVSGGTLQQLVDTGGPLAPARAVDAILQVVAGLEAANATGVLHRDVKPSNCFINAAGTVKVGDYGLSMSTMTLGQSTQLTIQGTFLGTPAFASPEQVSGNAVDARSDIYSVGATLYFLLTGRTPFAQATVMQVFAAVLREDPASPRIHVPAIPEPLAGIVLRCLRKGPAARYGTYADLRQALRPFSSKMAEAAPIRARVSAGAIDLLAVGLLMGLMVGSLQSVVTMVWAQDVLTWMLILGYFGIPEGRAGASLGKRLSGLRVVGSSQRPPGIVRAVLRTAVLLGTPFIGNILVEIRFGASTDPTPLSSAALLAINVLTVVALWTSARKRNGFRGLHEWATGTRVIQLTREVRDVAVHLVEPQRVGGEPIEQRIGGYVCDARLWSLGQEEVIGAHDEGLRRPVWIHRVPRGTPALTVARQNLARAGRLRVLATVRTDADSYDVFEAAEGMAVGSPQPWGVVRQWLLDLADELRAALDDGTMPGKVSIDQVWVTATGVRLLDVPVTRTAPSDAVPIHDFSSAQVFLGRLADRVRVKGPEPGLARWPLSASKVVDGLQRHTFGTIDDLRAATFPSSTRIAEVSRMRRLGSVARFAVLPVLFIAIGVAAKHEDYQIRQDPSLDSLNLALMCLDTMDRQMDHQMAPPAGATAAYRVGATVGRVLAGAYPRRAASDDPRQREAFRIYVGDAFGATIAEPKTWDILKSHKAAADRARDAALAASPADRQRAAIDAQPLLLKMHDGAARRLPPSLALVSAVLLIECLLLSVQALIAIVLAVLFRGPAGLRLAGLAVTTLDGAPLTRLRAMWRSIICWSPVIVTALAGPIVGLLTSTSDTALSLINSAGLLLFVAGIVWTIFVPDRGPQDRLAGTAVVPR